MLFGFVPQGAPLARRPWALESNAFGVSRLIIELAAMLTARQIIQRLRLVPLTIEGGYFRETYRSTLKLPADALPATYSGDRHVSTAIYYLLTPNTFSTIHRVKSDEVFHFYAGDAVEMLQLWPDGTGKTLTIGNDLASRHEPQVIVPAGVWQGCRLALGGEWALMGCTVAPGFEYADYQAGDREELAAAYPQFATFIVSLTRHEN
jgi:predicted cupin superfamily sugar epimerase